MLKNTTSQKGFSLLELLLVVAVGAVLILAGLSIYRNITNSTQTNDGIRLLNVIKQEVMRAYQGQSTYGTAGTDLEPMLVNMDAIPSSNLSGTDIVTPFFDGTADANAVRVLGYGETFRVVFRELPQDACLRIFTAITEDDKNLVGLCRGNACDASTSGLTITPAQASTSCGTGTTDLTWEFK